MNLKANSYFWYASSLAVIGAHALLLTRCGDSTGAERSGFSKGGASSYTVSNAGAPGGVPRSVTAGGGESASGGSGTHSSIVTGSGGAAGESSLQSTLGTTYAPTCAEQVCTAEEKCVTGPYGTYCAHLCPGQPCPAGGPQTSYCTRTGGVVCSD